MKATGERWERCLRQKKRPERVAAVGEGRRRTVAEDIRRAPQQELSEEWTIWEEL